MHSFLVQQEKLCEDRRQKAYMDLVIPEVFACVAELQENRVCDGLPGQRGARCPESDRHIVLPGDGQNLPDLLLIVDLRAK